MNCRIFLFNLLEFLFLNNVYSEILRYFYNPHSGSECVKCITFLIFQHPSLILYFDSLQHFVNPFDFVCLEPDVCQVEWAQSIENFTHHH